MSKGGYIALAVVLVIALVAIFTVSFVLYVKTPPPEGCERQKGGAQCENCEQSSCKFYEAAMAKAAKKEEEKKAEEEASEKGN